jgi:SAM-dependent methyltransferase
VDVSGPARLRASLQLARWVVARRTTPLSRRWGFDRGTPVDRWYIDRFVAAHARDIRGDVLEARDRRYTGPYGHAVTTADVLDVDASNAHATLVADLEQPSSFPEERYDCVVLTQVLQYVFDLRAAVESIHRTLRPGGVCLATIPVISRLDGSVADDAEHWRLTPASARRLFEPTYAPGAVEVARHGNARAAALFLLGLAAEELSPRELEAEDPSFPLIVTVRAVKSD